MTHPPLILLDPGHGGKDPGALANGLREADIVLDTALLLRGILDSRGYHVCLTRKKDVSVSLHDRAWMERTLEPGLFLSLHCNASANPDACGIEVFTSPGTTPADAAASRILEAIRASFPKRRYRVDFSDGDADKEELFYVLTRTCSPAILLEMGFLTHQEEARWLARRETCWEMALAIARGLDDWILTK